MDADNRRLHNWATRRLPELRDELAMWEKAGDEQMTVDALTRLALAELILNPAKTWPEKHAAARRTVDLGKAIDQQKATQTADWVFG